MTASGDRLQRRPSRDEVRARLLDAAADVFARRGIDGAGLAEIAAAAGLTKGAIYSNFSGKDDLVFALMDAQIAARETSAVAAFASADDPRAAARLVGDALTSASEEEADWQRLFVEYWSRAQRDEPTRERFAHRRAEAREQLTALLAREVRRHGVATELSAGELAVAILALSNGLALERRIERDAVPADLFGRILALLVAPSGA